MASSLLQRQLPISPPQLNRNKLQHRFCHHRLKCLRLLQLQLRFRHRLKDLRMWEFSRLILEPIIQVLCFRKRMLLVMNPSLMSNNVGSLYLKIWKHSKDNL